MVLRFGIILLAGFLASCSEGTPVDETSVGEEIYKNSCAACHGIDGKLGAGGAQDLTKSVLSEDAIKEIISKGRGAMPAQSNVVENDADMDEVVAHVMALRK